MQDSNNKECKGIQLKENEYIKDEMIYCSKCHQPKILDISTFGEVENFPFGQYVRVACQCDEERIKREEEQKKKDELELYFKVLQESSLLGETYKNATFENTQLNDNETFMKAYNTCKKYCENYERVLQDGKGLYLYGDCGVGKTHLMACMVNNLLRKGQQCLITNILEISKEIRKSFKNSSNFTETDFIKRISKIPFLFIDDIGTERLQVNGEDSFIQERIYDIINTRNSNLKPTIFSSNLSLVDLIEKGMWEKTVDRINGMVYRKIEIVGESYRRNIQSDFLD